MKEQVCPICSSTDSKWDLRKSGYDIYKCHHCNHFFVFPLPPAEQLEFLYSSRSGYHTELGSDYLNEGYFNKFFNHQIKKIQQHIPSGFLLDIGCSNGEFLELAKNYGYEIQGVEPNDTTSTIALNNGIPVFEGTLQQAHFPSNNFDIIHLGDIIEHVTDAHNLLTEVHRTLKPGGIILINTPNHDAFFPKATYFLYKKFGIPWSHPTPPHHLNQFSPTSISHLLSQMNFSVKEIYYLSCSLKYEISATHVTTDLKAAITNKSYSALPRLLFNTLAVGICYPVIWVIDKSLILKKQDFNMSVIAEKQSNIQLNTHPISNTN